MTILKRFEQRNEAARAAAAVTKVTRNRGRDVDRAPAGALATGIAHQTMSADITHDTGTASATHHTHTPMAAAATSAATGGTDASPAGGHEPQAAAAAPEAQPVAAAAAFRMVPTTDEEVVIESQHHGTHLHGTLNVPVDASGLVVFAHGSGSSRNSPRNRQVAAILNKAGAPVCCALFSISKSLLEISCRGQLNSPILCSVRVHCHPHAREPATTSLLVPQS